MKKKVGTAHDICDLMFTTNQNQLDTMNRNTIIHRLLQSVTPKTMHLTRFRALYAATTSLLTEQTCTVTEIGRNLDSKAHEKHCIKRVDRLLSNDNLVREVPLIYTMMTRMRLTTRHPIILVDWSHADTKQCHCFLRASLVCEGRSLTLYQDEVVTDNYHCPKVQNNFLNTLKIILPDDCRPVIVSDAGFKVPWFKKVQRLGSHYVGRIRGSSHFKQTDKTDFTPFSRLLTNKARTKELGDIKLTKTHQLKTRAVLVGKGHKLYKRDKNKTYKEPWLLVSSLPKRQNFMKKVIRCYAMRMQIELSFRDQKSTRFGLSANLHRTIKRSRLKILLLLVVLANWLSFVIGLTIEHTRRAGSLQANTVKKRRVLSWVYLGARYFKKPRFTLFKYEIIDALKFLKSLLNSLNWKTLNVA